MMTCVSLKSGMASRGSVPMAHHPAMQAIAIVVKTASLCSAEKSMILLIIVLPRGPHWPSRRDCSETPVCTCRNKNNKCCRDKRGCCRKLPPRQDPLACHTSDLSPFSLPPYGRLRQLAPSLRVPEQARTQVFSAGFPSRQER